MVDQIPPNVLVSNCVTHTFDFLTCAEGELQDITIPISVQVCARTLFTLSVPLYPGGGHGSSALFCS